MNPARESRLPDGLGITLSGLCILHCLALPAFFALLPMLALTGLGATAEAEWFHAGLLAPVVLVSGSVLGPRALRRRWLALVLVGALGAMTGALFAPTEMLERALTLGGASALIGAHWMGLRERTTG